MFSGTLLRYSEVGAISIAPFLSSPLLCIFIFAASKLISLPFLSFVITAQKMAQDAAADAAAEHVKKSLEQQNADKTD